MGEVATEPRRAAVKEARGEGKDWKEVVKVRAAGEAEVDCAADSVDGAGAVAVARVSGAKAAAKEARGEGKACG